MPPGHFVTLGRRISAASSSPMASMNGRSQRSSPTLLRWPTLAAVRNQDPAPADAQLQFLSALTFGVISARHVRVSLVALFALMVEMCATLGLFAALSHSFQKPAVFDQNPTVPPAAQWKPKAAS
jgi:hypothetical protein